MQFSVCTYGFAMFAISLAVQLSEARVYISNPPSIGLLDNMPQNCSTLDYCLERHDKYPQDTINKLLNKYHFTLGSSHDYPVMREEPAQDESCEKFQTYGPIYEIRDKDGNVRVVVQSQKLFQQIIRIERCISTKPTGFGLMSAELKRNNLFCAEKKLDYNFLVLTLDGNGVEFVKSKSGIPVCCSCRIR